MAHEDCQNGRMCWRQDNDKIYVLYNTRTWARYNDIWQEGQPEFTCGGPDSPPTPKRGFGKIWCENPAVKNGLGNATTGEWGDNGLVQDFAGGTIMQVSGRTYALYTDSNSWN